MASEPDEDGTVPATAHLEPTPHLVLDGVRVYFYRDEDGLLTVAVYTEDARLSDTFEGEVPRLALIVNEAREELRADGSWETMP